MIGRTEGRRRERRFRPRGWRASRRPPVVTEKTAETAKTAEKYSSLRSPRAPRFFLAVLAPAAAALTGLRRLGRIRAVGRRSGAGRSEEQLLAVRIRHVTA